MAVNLSPVGGVAAQFFDNNGVILSGGKIFTYAAGTTTNQATYTSASGVTAHSNPIILDSAGRVPSGEIWLTDGLSYKFVIKNASDVLIGTYDNIVGINSNFLNYSIQEEVQTATAGQTVFTLSTVTYTPNTNTLQVFVDGVNQYDGASYAYVETDSTTVTFTAGLHVGALVKFTTAVTLSAGVTDASLVTYDPPFTGGVATNVELKLAQTVSVKDFGAVGNGVADDTAAINAALQTANTVLLPQGTYKITSQLIFGLYCGGLIGEGMYTSVISKTFNGNAILCDASGAVMQHFGVVGNGATYTGGGIVPRGYNITIQNCRITDTADSCILVAGAVGSNALAATYLSVDNCFLNPTNASTTYSIRSITPDDSNRPTDRSFNNINGGSSLIDFSGMNYATLSNSLGTTIKFDNNCSKICISNNRFTNSAASIVIYGQAHVIENNVWGFGVGYALSIDATAVGVYFGPTNNIVIGTSSFSSIVDGATIGGGNFNNLTTQLKTYPIGWYASTTDPTLGNSATYSYYKQEGRMCFATFGFVRGSTATVGVGIYSFQLPFKAYVTAMGPVRVKSSSGTYYCGTLIVQGSSSVGYVYLDQFTSEFASTTLAFANGAQFDCSISYLISPT